MNRQAEDGKVRSTGDTVESQAYEILIKGQLSRDWADWFERMQLICLENGDMVLYGILTDQAALMGILNKLNRLNLTILSVNIKDPAA
jgi:hypothetical protein